MNATVTVEPYRTLIAFPSPVIITVTRRKATVRRRRIRPSPPQAVRLQHHSDVENAQEISDLLPPDELRRFVGHLRRAAVPVPNGHDSAPLIATLTGGTVYDAATRRRLEEEALLRQVADRRALLAGAVKTSAVARLLGRSRQAVHDRVRADTLLAINDSGELRFPLWQFDPGAKQGVVPGLPDVLRALDVSPLSKARWLTRPNPALEGRTPLDALKAGERERVVSEAHGVGLA